MTKLTDLLKYFWGSLGEGEVSIGGPIKIPSRLIVIGLMVVAMAVGLGFCDSSGHILQYEQSPPPS